MKKEKNQRNFNHFSFYKKNKFKSSGITLIALIITIIVLLILAGVTIAAITSNESAPNKAVEAREENDKGAMKDAAALKATNLIQEYMEKKYISKQSLGTGIVTAGDYVANQIGGTEGEFTYFVSSKYLNITDTKGNIVTGTILDNGNINWVTTPPTDHEEPEIQVEPLENGTEVDYTTSLNGVTLDNWKVFYSDENYTYIILSDYLPNAAVNITNIEKNQNYVVYTDENRSTLLNAMSTKSNWNPLLTGTLNGTTIDYSQSTDTNIWAMGAPTIDLWVKSWNKSYSDDILYTLYSENIDNSEFDGYYVGTSINPNNRYWTIDLSAKDGYDNPLYYPYKEGMDNSNCYSYWLASPHSYSEDHIVHVNCGGYIGYDTYGNAWGCAFRPVIKLPTSVLNQ